MIRRVKYDTTKLCHVILHSYIRIQEGKPSSDYHQDSEGKPESAASKAVKGSAKLAAKITKIVVKNTGIVDDDTADIISSVADAAENQADASRDATIGDRLKMGGRYIVAAHYNLYSYLPRQQSCDTHGVA